MKSLKNSLRKCTKHYSLLPKLNTKKAINNYNKLLIAFFVCTTINYNKESNASV